MANDPNRDLLPVKEETYGRCSSSERFDHQILGKLPRCELEDKFLRLFDEQTSLKKLVNCQEEKIKRLGTKLLRLIGEKKNGKRNFEPSKEADELTIRVTELEHENYALRDKNVVLKQQLANHTRHMTAHRSPVRSLHTSPLISVRQPAPPLQPEMMYEASNKNVSSESQLREAESHIKELNEEIKALHCKIDFLQQNMERNCLDSRKSKVTENIELIRLQRSLKQQAIQIASLQAQVKNSENNQKILKEELVKAHNENDEALHLISVKQSEILNLCNKLEETNLSRLEEGELRERIKDLMLERDCLKERSDFLMKSIGVKSEETDRINKLKKSLAEEKLKKKQLEEALEDMKKELLDIKKENRESRTSQRTKSADSSSKETIICQCKKSLNPNNGNRQIDEKEHKNVEMECKTQTPSKECIKPLCPAVTILKPEFEENTELSETSKNKVEGEKNMLSETTEGKYFAEKLSLEREVQYLREMLRSQTCRCEAQQAEIKRLMFELRVNEEKCSETLQKLDAHLKLFQDFQIKSQGNRTTFVDSGVGEYKVENEIEEIKPQKRSLEADKISEQETVETSGGRESVESVKNISRRESTSNIERNPVASSKTVTLQIDRKEPTQDDARKRFIDQIFLESSDEESGVNKVFRKEPAIKKQGDIESEKNVKKPKDGESEFRWRSKDAPVVKTAENKRSQSESSLETSVKSPLNARSSDNDEESEKKREGQNPTKPKNLTRGEGLDVSRFVEIRILWLKIDPKSSVGQNANIKLVFVDFSFLDVSGEETETPDSVQKPTKADEKCHFNFMKIIDIDDNRKKSLQSMLNKPDLDLIVFKVVSEPEDNHMDLDCEDIGVATVTVKQFLDHCAKGPFLISVENMLNTTEILGTLAVSFDASPEIFNYRK